MLQGDRRVCIAAAYTTQPFGRIVPIGLPLPLAGSAAGHALLSQLDATALELVLEDICDGPEAEAVRTRSPPFGTGCTRNRSTSPWPEFAA
jgi:DNA-binding IclR family transcriptional regulator